MIRSRTYIAIPPGETIKELLGDRGISQKEFAARMGMTEKHISKLINGDVQLTIEVARRLEYVLGGPTTFWCNLEALYREEIIKANEENSMCVDIEIAKKMPYRQMVQNGWIADTSKWSEKVNHLRKYYEVAQLSYLKGTLVPGIACRKLSETEKSYYAFLAWVQKAKLEARKIETKKINIKKLNSILPDIRQMTELKFEDACKRLQQCLAECGVATVFLPYVEGSFLHGATFRLGNKIVMGIAVREKENEKFWFSLFHELAHIVLGHMNQKEGTSDEEELQADSFAKKCLQNPGH